MKLRICIAAATFACMAGAASAQMAGADANGDGQVTRAEAQAARGVLFDRVDTNRDGYISPEEQRAAAEQRQRRGFEHTDANRDGRVSRQEFLNQPMRLFDRVDADSNGVLSAEELERARAMAQRRRS